MAEPTFADVDALIGPSTPHFAYQLRARVREIVAGLAPDHPVRRYAETQLQLLDDLGHASSRAAEDPGDRRRGLGWSEIPSSAPVAAPLARREP
jgi:hypothetical protein